MFLKNFKRSLIFILIVKSEVYLIPCQTSKMEIVFTFYGILAQILVTNGNSQSQK